MGSLLTITHPRFTGMLSKSNGQVLRLSTVLHLVFHCNEEDRLPDLNSEAAIKAAISFVQVSCQQTAVMTGKG